MGSDACRNIKNHVARALWLGVGKGCVPTRASSPQDAKFVIFPSLRGHFWCDGTLCDLIQGCGNVITHYSHVEPCDLESIAIKDEVDNWLKNYQNGKYGAIRFPHARMLHKLLLYMDRAILPKHAVQMMNSLSTEWVMARQSLFICRLRLDRYGRTKLHRLVSVFTPDAQHSQAR